MCSNVEINWEKGINNVVKRWNRTIKKMWKLWKIKNTRHSSIKITTVERLATKPGLQRKRTYFKKDTHLCGLKTIYHICSTKYFASYVHIQDSRLERRRNTMHVLRSWDTQTNEDIYRIGKDVKNGKTKSIVQWKFYPSSFNSWVSNQGFGKYMIISPILWNDFT